MSALEKILKIKKVIGVMALIGFTIMSLLILVLALINDGPIPISYEELKSAATFIPLIISAACMVIMIAEIMGGKPQPGPEYIEKGIPDGEE